jgi:hypothetical protein
MTGESKNIDKLFRNGLKELRENPPAYAWKKLDHALDVVGSAKRMMFYRLLAASVLILMAFGAGYFYASYMNNPSEVVSQEAIKEPEPAENLQIIPEQPFIVTEELAGAKPDPVKLNITGKSILVHPGELAYKKESDAETILPTHSGDDAMSNDHSPSSGSVITMASLDVIEIDLIHPASKKIKFPSSGAKNIYSENLGLYPDYSYEKPVSSLNKWSVGAQFAPTYSYREISQNYSASLAADQDAVENLNNVENALLSYAGGMDVGFNFSEKWSVQSGVYFSRIGQVNSDALEFKKNSDDLLLYAINTSTGRINVAFERVPEEVKKISPSKDSIGMGAINEVKIIQNFDLFEIPLVVRYKFLNRKFSMNLSGGLSPAYLLDNNTYLEMEDQKYDVGDAGNLNTMIVNTSLGMGFEYLITKKLSVNFEPTFKYSLNPINNSSSIDYHPYYFSWFTGVRLKIQ